MRNPESLSLPPVPAGAARITNLNFFFIILLVRSGLQILVEHPRLYWNVHCTPNTEWLRLTPIEVLREKCGDGTVTFVYAARDEQHNGALVLKDFLEHHTR